jgi:hypothetical protein
MMLTVSDVPGARRTWWSLKKSGGHELYYFRPGLGARP